MQNPYTTLFGRIPYQIIPRAQQMASVVDDFSADRPNQQVFVITGVRGSGKTVFMTGLERELQRDERWIVEELSIEQDLVSSLVAQLNSRRPLATLFLEAGIDLSFFGLGLRIQAAPPITDIKVALSQMLAVLQRKGMRLLVSIDEVVNNEHMRAFASVFQILVREDLPIFLLMTGLYENVASLQNEKSLTFLYRAPKLRLEPLGTRSIARNYQRTFDISHDNALSMARHTNGYSFAFQLLGYLVWEQGGLSSETLEDYKSQLYELSYDKIWDELSAGDRRVAHGIACADSSDVQVVRSVLGMQSNQFAPYRRRLMNKGVIDGEQRGQVSFTLPYFREYVLEHYGETELDTTAVQDSER